MIKNIIFDLGVVIFDIKAESLWHKEDLIPVIGQKGFDFYINNNLFLDVEGGLINSDELYQILKSNSDKNFSFESFSKAWTARLQVIPDTKWQLLELLSQKYRLFLLSNSNEIHVKWIKNYIFETKGAPLFNTIFEKQYFSHELKMAKPNRDIYDFVLSDTNIKVNETMFIDDAINNLNYPSKIGITTIHYKNYNQLITELKKYLIL